MGDGEALPLAQPRVLDALPCVLTSQCCPPAQVELIHYVLGPQHLRDVTTANLERFMRRFNELQYWVATELCLCSVPGLRAQLLRKFIKLAAQ